MLYYQIVYISFNQLTNA